MSDGPIDMEAHFRQMLLAETPARRLAMGCGMFSTAKALIRAGIVSEFGGSEPEDLRQRIFLRLYGRDFDVSRQENILRCLKRHSL
jgi:hypothetical protein